MKFMYLRTLFIAFLLTLCGNSFAQPTEKLVKVIVAPDHNNWTYKLSDPVKFRITVLKNGNPVPDAKIYYEVGPEKMEATQKNTVSAKGDYVVTSAGMKAPGFLRCVATTTVDGIKYTGSGTAGFAPSEIRPTTTLPTDFLSFWSDAKKELAKIPIDAKMTLLPDASTSKVNVYEVSFANFPLISFGTSRSRIYGILCVPKGEGKFPALLQVPGAGVRPYAGYIEAAEKGIISLQIGIHGVPVTMPMNVYDNLRGGALNGYQVMGLNDKNIYYYKRVYLGCVRANDFLTSLPEYDGKNLGVTGGSQGGALSIITAALDDRVQYLASYYPALSDLTGYLSGRAGGWPHMFRDRNSGNSTKECIETSKYYDVVNFARHLKIPGHYSWGYNDETCPPTSMFAAYNVITAPKELLPYYETGHWTYPEQREAMDNWLYNRLLKK